MVSPPPLTLFLLKWYTATMLARSSTMHRPWKDATASRRALSSCTVQGVSSRQKGQPSRHGRHLLAKSGASSLLGPRTLPGDVTEQRPSDERRKITRRGRRDEEDETTPSITVVMMSSARGDRSSQLSVMGCLRCVNRLN